MDERAAIDVVAVRAVETADRSRDVWSDADRAWASRAAAEVVGEGGSPHAFVARRARLAIERLRERKHRVARLAHAWRWRSWVGVAVALAAFVLGALADEVGGGKRVNVLSPPVALLVLWNLAVYALVVGRYVVRYGEPGAPGPLVRALTWLAGGARSAGRARDEAVTTFVADWSAAAAPTYAARAARLLHVAAAMLALGVIAGLYVRGLGLEYRATWESTFLEPSTVHAIVKAMYAVGALVTGIAVPDVAHVAAIRAPASENAATWLHLMAATLAAVVVVPRLVLALASAMVERYRASRFLTDLGDAYYQRLLRGFHPGSVSVIALPYSFTVPEGAAPSLELLLARAFGGNVSVMLAPAVTYGDEDAATASGSGNTVVALFNAAATPEREAHGRFLDRLATPGRTLVVVVDESAQNARFEGDTVRREGRRDLWRELAAEVGRVPVFVDLAQPDVDAAEAAFERALS